VNYSAIFSLFHNFTAPLLPTPLQSQANDILKDQLGIYNYKSDTKSGQPCTTVRYLHFSTTSQSHYCLHLYNLTQMTF